MRIETVYFRDFPPFADAQLTFPKVETPGKGELHLLVGQNGTGKTRLLSLLAAALGNPNELYFRSDEKVINRSLIVAHFGFELCVWSARLNAVEWTSKEFMQQIVTRFLTGQLLITNYGENFLSKQNRPAYADPCTALAFRGTSRVSDAPIVAMNAVVLGDPTDWLLFDHTANTDLLIGQIMANIKIGAAMEMMSRNGNNPGRIMKIVTRLEAAITHVTGRKFYYVVEPNPKIAIKVFWDEVPMMLKQLPDGLRSIISWLVSSVAKIITIHADHEDPLSLPLILLLDEPESHLHPAWQRKVLPAAQALFPQAQMFVAGCNRVSGVG